MLLFYLNKKIRNPTFLITLIHTQLGQGVSAAAAESQAKSANKLATNHCSTF
jgi:hypothetical protein